MNGDGAVEMGQAPRTAARRTARSQGAWSHACNTKRKRDNQRRMDAHDADIAWMTQCAGGGGCGAAGLHVELAAEVRKASVALSDHLLQRGD